LSNLFIKKLVLLVDVSDEDDDYEIISNQQNDTDDLESVVTYSGNRFTTNQSFKKKKTDFIKIEFHFVFKQPRPYSR